MAAKPPSWGPEADAVYRAHQHKLRGECKVRACLKCGRVFVSQHYGVRMCVGCRGDAAVWGSLPRPADGYRGINLRDRA